MSELIRIRVTAEVIDIDEDMDWEELGLPYPIEYQKEAAADMWLEWYTPDTFEAERLKSIISELPFIITQETDTVTSDDWQSYWKQHFSTRRVGDHFVLVPEWEMDEYEAQEGDKVLLIRPGLGFGTGDHFTTSYCLKVLERYGPSHKHFVDVGTGSGILAIAAVKLGIARVEAFDHDAVACECARENLELNGVTGKIQLACQDLGESAPIQAEMVCANLYDTLLIRFADRLAPAASSILVLTGIRCSEANSVQACYEEQGLTLLDRTEDGEWCGLTFSQT